MFKGNVRAALALVDDMVRHSTFRDPVSPDELSWAELQKKHPPGQTCFPGPAYGYFGNAAQDMADC